MTMFASWVPIYALQSTFVPNLASWGPSVQNEAPIWPFGVHFGKIVRLGALWRRIKPQLGPRTPNCASQGPCAQGSAFRGPSWSHSGLGSRFGPFLPPLQGPMCVSGPVFFLLDPLSRTPLELKACFGPFDPLSRNHSGLRACFGPLGPPARMSWNPHFAFSDPALGPTQGKARFGPFGPPFSDQFGFKSRFGPFGALPRTLL